MYLGIIVDEFIEQSRLVVETMQQNGGLAPELARCLPTRFRAARKTGQVFASGRLRIVKGDRDEPINAPRVHELAGASEINCRLGSLDGAEVVVQMNRFSHEDHAKGH